FCPLDVHRRREPAFHLVRTSCSATCNDCQERRSTGRSRRCPVGVPCLSGSRSVEPSMARCPRPWSSRTLSSDDEGQGRFTGLYCNATISVSNAVVDGGEVNNQARSAGLLRCGTEVVML